MSFNSRGLGGAGKSNYIKELVIKEELDMVCIQETKQEGIMLNLCKSWWGCNSVECVSTIEQNRADGILIAWNTLNFNLTKSECGKGFIIIKGKWRDSSECTTIVNVYSPCETNDKRVLWEELINRKRVD